MVETYTDTPMLGARFERALTVALEHHRRQLRKGTRVPYVAHLLGVASLVLEMGGTEDEAIAGLLHDVVEDGGGRAALEDIRGEFGEDVARVVEANSDSFTDVKPDWAQRKLAYVASIAQKRPDEIRVSLADKLHNARALLLDYRTHGEDLWTRFKAGEGGSIRRYYGMLCDAFEARRVDLGPGAEPALGELRRTLDELDRLAS
jgi:GTP pyrophosphokinase